MPNETDEREKMDREKEKKQEDIGIIWRGEIKVNEKRSEILEDICIALNASNVDAMPRLVESAFDVGYTAEEIKNRVRICMARPDFDVICEFCRAMRFEENRRSEKWKKSKREISRVAKELEQVMKSNAKKPILVIGTKERNST